MAVGAHHIRLAPLPSFPNAPPPNSSPNAPLSMNVNASCCSSLVDPRCLQLITNTFVPAGLDGSNMLFSMQPSPSDAPPAAPAPRKRQMIAAGGMSFLGEDMSPHVDLQQMEIDRLIAQHAEKMRAEVMERRKRISMLLKSAVENGVARRIRAKEEEIERIGKINWALEQRIRSLCLENQVWRDIAQANEAAAAVLRCNLEQILAAQQFLMPNKEEEDEDPAAAGGSQEDAESCCGDSAAAAEEEFMRTAGVRRRCRCCDRRETAVLLLPCRHLCVCEACAPATDVCPVCNCGKNGSVVVNMSA